MAAFITHSAAAVPGQRVFFTGNSFHMKAVELFPEIVQAAKIDDHHVAGTMLLGGSRAITLWDKPDAENPAKTALQSGAVDVLTLCPWRQIPDPGVDAFVDLTQYQHQLCLAKSRAIRLARRGDANGRFLPPLNTCKT